MATRRRLPVVLWAALALAAGGCATSKRGQAPVAPNAEPSPATAATGSPQAESQPPDPTPPILEPQDSAVLASEDFEAESLPPTELGFESFEPAPMAPQVAADSPAPAAASADAAPAVAVAEPKEPFLANPCAEWAPQDEAMIDTARRRLYQTACNAALWFDGLFGERSHPAAARRAYGRLEISVLGSEFDGVNVRTKLDLRVKFPNLEERLEAFIGRDDDDDFISDRKEGLAMRSQFVNVETEERWLAGLGYSLPGSYKQKVDFRVGGKGGREPKIFAQGRLRRNFVVDEHNLWHFRETLFWTNRDGFGATTSLDYTRVLSADRLLRWGNTGTWSEETDGLDWRSALVLYHDIKGQRALAYEVYLRGATEAEVQLREYGTRAIYRQNLMGRKWLAGEIVVGYAWPKEEIEMPREGSATVGFGIELRYGRD